MNAKTSHLILSLLFVLPQIASVADRHFRVEKITGDPTHTRIELLGESERRDELQRMLGGREFIASVRK